MQLMRLHLRNFKGVRDLELNPNGKPLTVHGDNGTGKTTIADAWSWLLFGKDSSGRADFDVKTLTETGEPHHGLEHEVEAELRMEGKPDLTLRRVYHETWSKGRGEARRKLSGHTTEYYVDGVPSRKKDYEARVSEVAPEDTFHLLTEPLQFPERLHWQQRRDILLGVCGDVSDSEVIDSDKALSDLEDMLSERSVEDYRKILAQRRKKVNQSIELLPVRIDEVTRGLPDIPESTTKATSEEALVRLQARRDEAQHKLDDLRAGGAVIGKTQELRNAESVLQSAHTCAREKVEALRQSGMGALLELQERRASAYALVLAARRAVSDADERCEFLVRSMEERREEWRAIDAELFKDSGPDTCPSCNQPLPPGEVQEARNKALGQFNVGKAGRLEAVDAWGRKLKEEHDELKANSDDREEAVAKAEKAMAAIDTAITEARKARDGIADATEPDDSDATRLRAELADLQASEEATLDPAVDALNSIEEDIQKVREELALFSQKERSEARIIELGEEERLLAAEFEEIERALFLTEEFVRAKVRLLEDKINSRFSIARFRLFRIQVNGALDECCDVMHDGVPWASLNTGSQLNIGIDIINTLAAHYDFAPPVFVDHAESITDLKATTGQQIRLVVSAEDKALRVVEEAV